MARDHSRATGVQKPNAKQLPPDTNSDRRRFDWIEEEDRLKKDLTTLGELVGRLQNELNEAQTKFVKVQGAIAYVVQQKKADVTPD